MRWKGRGLEFFCWASLLYWGFFVSILIDFPGLFEKNDLGVTPRIGVVSTYFTFIPDTIFVAVAGPVLFLKYYRKLAADLKKQNIDVATQSDLYGNLMSRWGWRIFYKFTSGFIALVIIEKICIYIFN